MVDFRYSNANFNGIINTDIASNDGRNTEVVTSQNDLHQEINEPTYF